MKVVRATWDVAIRHFEQNQNVDTWLLDNNNENDDPDCINTAVFIDAPVQARSSDLVDTIFMEGYRFGIYVVCVSNKDGDDNIKYLEHTDDGAPIIVISYTMETIHIFACILDKTFIEMLQTHFPKPFRNLHLHDCLSDISMKNPEKRPTLFANVKQLVIDSENYFSFSKLFEWYGVRPENLVDIETHSFLDFRELKFSVSFGSLSRLFLRYYKFEPMTSLSIDQMCYLFPRLNQITHPDMDKCDYCRRGYELQFSTPAKVYGACAGWYFESCKDIAIQNRAHVYAILKRVFWMNQDVAEFICRHFICRFAFPMPIEDVIEHGMEYLNPKDHVRKGNAPISYSDYKNLAWLVNEKQNLKHDSSQEAKALEASLDVAFESYTKIRKLK